MGALLRGLGSAPALFVGMVLAGGGIGVAGVLLPGIVKRDYPGHAGLMTGCYTMALCLGAALAAGTTVPLAHQFGSAPLALAFWALPALVALLLWRYGDQRLAPGSDRPKPRWHAPLAWQVTLFMGLQSSLAYTVFAWHAQHAGKPRPEPGGRRLADLGIDPGAGPSGAAGAVHQSSWP